MAAGARRASPNGTRERASTASGSTNGSAAHRQAPDPACKDPANGAGADTIGAVHRDMPERGVAPGGLGRRTKEATMTTTRVALVLLCLMTGTAMAQQPKVT